LILYVVYSIRGNKEKLKDALKKSAKIFIQNSITLFAIFAIIAILEKFLSPKAFSAFLLKFN
jgi:hypothetical protein